MLGLATVGSLISASRAFQDGARSACESFAWRGFWDLNSSAFWPKKCLLRDGCGTKFSSLLVGLTCLTTKWMEVHDLSVILGVI